MEARKTLIIKEVFHNFLEDFHKKLKYTEIVWKKEFVDQKMNLLVRMVQ